MTSLKAELQKRWIVSLSKHFAKLSRDSTILTNYLSAKKKFLVVIDPKISVLKT